MHANAMRPTPRNCARYLSPDARPVGALPLPPASCARLPLAMAAHAIPARFRLRPGWISLVRVPRRLVVGAQTNLSLGSPRCFATVKDSRIVRPGAQRAYFDRHIFQPERL